MYAHDIIEFGSKDERQNKIEIKINSSADEILYFIQLIKDEIQILNIDFIKLKDFCLELIQRLPLPIQLLQNTFILRSRENMNGEVFNFISELSYNSSTDKINLGRFNLDSESVFYGAAPITSNNASGQLTSICESCKELFDTNSHFDTKYFTVGKWNILIPLKIVILTFFKGAEQNSVHLSNINPHYLDFISSSCSEEDFKKCLNFYSLFSEYAAKKYDDKNSYLLTTAFLHSLKEFYGDELGILYSSSMTENTGLNIALTKELIDSGHLKFEGAAMFKIVRNKNNYMSYHINPCTNYAIADQEGKFKFNYIL